MTEKQIKELSQRLARKLFTAGGHRRGGKKAQRLVMEFPGQYINATGWAQQIVRDLIREAIENTLARSERKQSSAR